jgi:hypothetical protein
MYVCFLKYYRTTWNILKQNMLCRYVSESGCAHISQQMWSTSRPKRNFAQPFLRSDCTSNIPISFPSHSHLIPISFPSHSHLIPISKLRWNSKKLSLLDILLQLPGDLKSQQVRVTYGDMSRHESQAWHPKNPINTWLMDVCVPPKYRIKRFWPIPIPETTKIHQPHQPLSCLLLVWHALGSWLHRTVGQ